MIRFLFKQSQPKKFDFKPRYYSAQKEYLESREELVRRELELQSEVNQDAGGEALRSHLRTTWNSRSRSVSKRKSNRNVLIIAALLSIIAYLLLLR